MDLKSFVSAVAAMISGTKTDLQLAKETAIGQFKRRLSFAGKHEKYENEDLPAGSPVYVYCKHCGILIAEDYLFRLFNECSQCVGLKENGWLDEAKR